MAKFNPDTWQKKPGRKWLDRIFGTCYVETEHTFLTLDGELHGLLDVVHARYRYALASTLESIEKKGLSKEHWPFADKIFDRARSLNDERPNFVGMLTDAEVRFLRREEPNVSLEQQARNLLERMEIPNAQAFSSGELTELANLIAKRNIAREPSDRLAMAERLLTEAIRSGAFRNIPEEKVPPYMKVYYAMADALITEDENRKSKTP